MDTFDLLSFCLIAASIHSFTSVEALRGLPFRFNKKPWISAGEKTPFGIAPLNPSESLLTSSAVTEALTLLLTSSITFASYISLPSNFDIEEEGSSPSTFWGDRRDGTSYIRWKSSLACVLEV